MRVLALVLVFAFAALGGAYAMWSDTLVVDETVKTGILNVTWDSDMHIPDPGPNYTGYGGNVYGVTSSNEGLDELDNGNPNNAKNIGALNAVVGGQDGDANAYSNVNDSLVITLENGYPGYQDRIFTQIMNVGTVPAKLDINSIGIPSWLLVEIWFDADPTKAKDNGEDFMVWSSTGATPLEALEGYQLDPGEKIAVAIYTRVLQAAPQNITDDFTINLKAIQWNEYEFELPTTIQTIDRKDPHFDPDNGVNVTETKFKDVVVPTP